MVDAYLQQKDGDHWRSLWGTATTNGAGMWPLLRMQFALPGFSFSHNLCASPLAGAFFIVFRYGRVPRAADVNAQQPSYDELCHGR